MKNEIIQYVELDKIVLKPQVRDNADDSTISGLAMAMERIGLQQPIRLRREGDLLIVVDGERRYRAARRLGWPRIATIFEDRELPPADIIQRQLIANGQRKPLTPLEFARAVSDLMREAKCDQDAAAAACGYSAATISRQLRILELPEDIKRDVACGKIAASTAYEIAKAESTKQRRLAEKAVREGANRQTIRREAKRSGGRAKAGKRRSTPKVIATFGANPKVTTQRPELTTLETLIAWFVEALGFLREIKDRGGDLVTIANAKGNLQQACRALSTLNTSIPDPS